MPYCRYCGCELDNSAKFCQECGKPTKEEYKTKSKVIAVILLLLLGYLGVHKFYLGKNKEGVIFLIGWIIAVLFASLNFPPFTLFPMAMLGIALLVDLVLILKE